MTQEEMINHVQKGILKQIPFLPATQLRINDSDDFEMLRNAKRAVDEIVKKSAVLSKKYPYEFRNTLMSICSMVGPELQSFDHNAQQENE